MRTAIDVATATVATTVAIDSGTVVIATAFVSVVVRPGCIRHSHTTCHRTGQASFRLKGIVGYRKHLGPGHPLGFSGCPSLGFPCCGLMRLIPTTMIRSQSPSNRQVNIVVVRKRWLPRGRGDRRSLSTCSSCESRSRIRLRFVSFGSPGISME